MDHPDGSQLSDVRLRDAGTEELDELARLLAEVYGAFRGHLPDRAWERYIGEIADVRSRMAESELIVAEARGRLVGTIGFYPDASRSAIERWPSGWASIRTLGVRGEARRGGVGTALAGECVRRAQARGTKAIGLHTAAHMDTATRLYERLGFRRAPEFDNRDRRDVHRPVAAPRRQLAGAGVPARPRGGNT